MKGSVLHQESVVQSPRWQLAVALLLPFVGQTALVMVLPLIPGISRGIAVFVAYVFSFGWTLLGFLVFMRSLRGGFRWSGILYLLAIFSSMFAWTMILLLMWVGPSE